MNRRMGMQSRSASFGLSFIDMVSGGFGAAFFLFLIFASLPIEEPSREAGGGSRFIEIWMTWPSGSERAEIYLKHSDSQEIRLTSGSFTEEPNTGRLNQIAPLDIFWERGTSSGFSWFGSNAMSNFENGENTIRFRLINPCGGSLKIGGAVHGRSKGTDWLTDSAPVKVPADFTVIVSNGADKRQVYEGSSVLNSSVRYTNLYLDGVETSINLSDVDEEWSWCI